MTWSSYLMTNSDVFVKKKQVSIRHFKITDRVCCIHTKIAWGPHVCPMNLAIRVYIADPSATQCHHCLDQYCWQQTKTSKFYCPTTHATGVNLSEIIDVEILTANNEYCRMQSPVLSLPFLTLRCDSESGRTHRSFWMNSTKAIRNHWITNKCRREKL